MNSKKTIKIKQSLKHSVVNKQRLDKFHSKNDKNSDFQVVTCPNCDGSAIDFGDHIFCDECGYIQHKV